jgi:hypothetical protein
MGCKPYHEALMAAALGAPRAAEFEAHLRACADCRAELERQQQLAAAMDLALVSSLAVEPSPEFAARVRQRLAEEPAPRAAWFPGWLPAAAGALGVALLVWWLIPPRTAPPAPEAPVVAKVEPGPPAPVEGRAPSPAPKAARPSRPAPLRAAGSPGPPEILLPLEQRQGVEWLYRALQRRPERTHDLLAQVQERAREQAETVQVAGLAIPRLEILPLGPAENRVGSELLR